VLVRLISERGAPRYLRSDNGPEFVSKAILKWLEKVGIETALIDPGKPWQNGMDESFNGRFRDECLSLEWFRSRREAKVIIESGAVITTSPAAFEPRLSHATRIQEAASVHSPGSRSKVASGPKSPGQVTEQRPRTCGPRSPFIS
jgi:transposase InsO family protein